MSITASTQIEIPIEEPIFPYENIINYIPFEEDLNIVSNDNLSFYAPFDSDANDISGSGVIGTVTTATNTTGYISNGYDFNGADGKISYGNILPLSSGGSISVWIKADSVGESSFGRIINKANSSAITSGYTLYVTAIGIGFTINSTSIFSSSLRSIEFNKWYHIVITFTATEKKLYINGSLKETYTGASLLPSNVANNFLIGNADDSDRTFDGLIDEVRVYDNRILSASEVLSLFRNATNKPATQTITDYKTNTPLTITGNIFSATGKVGSGIYFNGATRVENNSITDLAAIGTGDFTYSLWFKKNKNNTTERLITIVGISSPPRLHIDVNNYLVYAGTGITLKSLATITDTNWHHAVLIRENSIFYAYLDGILQGTLTGESSSFASATDIYIGQDSGGTNSFNGYLDEVFIFNTAISYAEVRGLYELTPIKTISGDINYLDLIEQAKSGETIIDGGYIKTNLLETDNALIGSVEIDKNLFSYYNFDNGTIAPTDYCLYAPLNKCNSTFYYNDICAFTKVGNTAYSSSQKISGQYSAVYDGTTDSLWTTGITLGCNVTVSGWAYATDYTGRMLWAWDSCHTNNLNLYFNSGYIYNSIYDAAANPFKKADNTNLSNPSTSAWHHYTVVHSGDKNCSMLYIDGSCCAGAIYRNPAMTNSCFLIGSGQCIGDYSWNGYIQEVKLYNRELSPSEIKNLSSEFSSTLFPDASGNQNTIQMVGSKPALGVANNGQYLDGYNDYGQINNSNLNSNHSFTIWINSNDLTIKQTLLHKEGSFSYYLDSGKPAVKIAAGVVISSNKNIVDNSWHFISYVLEGTTISIYIDGELDAIGTVSALIQNTADILVGATDTVGNNSFGGYLDEIRIYNRILTENEIKYLYKFKNAHGGTIISGDRIQTGVLRSNLKITCQSSSNFDKPVSEYCLDNGTFILRNATSGVDALSFNGSDLSVAGTICSAAGSIGGWSINSDSIYANNKICMHCSGYIEAGSLAGGLSATKTCFSDGGFKFYVNNGSAWCNYGTIAIDADGFNISGAKNSNLFIGDGAGDFSSGGCQIFIGHNVGCLASGSNHAIFIGNEAGVEAWNSWNSVFLGVCAGRIARRAVRSIFIGDSSGNETCGSDISIFMGYQAGICTRAAFDSIFIGDNAGYKTLCAYSSIFIGALAGANANYSNYSNFIGDNAGHNACCSSYSNFIGYYTGVSACFSNTSNFIGYAAGIQACRSSHSNFIGYNAGYCANGVSYSNLIGDSAGWLAFCSCYSNFIGENAGTNSDNSTYSNFFGYMAGNNSRYSCYSNFIGGGAGGYAKNSSYSNFFGSESGTYACRSDYSNFIGYNSGHNACCSINSIFIGTNVGHNVGGRSNLLLIGSAYYASSNPTCAQSLEGATLCGDIATGDLRIRGKVAIGTTGAGSNSNTVYIKDSNNQLKERTICDGVWSYNYNQHLCTGNNVVFANVRASTGLCVASHLCSTATMNCFSATSQYLMGTTTCINSCSITFSGSCGMCIFGCSGCLVLRSCDGWLRINDTSPHVSGVYFGSSLIRTDGQIQLGGNGVHLLVTTACLRTCVPVSVCSTITSSDTIRTNSCMNFCGCINLMWNNTEKSLDFVFI